MKFYKKGNDNVKWVISVACALLIFISTIYVRQPAPSPESQIVEEEIEQTPETTTVPRKEETTEFIPRLERTTAQTTEPPSTRAETSSIEPTATTEAREETTTTKKYVELETLATIGTLPTLARVGDAEPETKPETTKAPSTTAPETTKATTTTTQPTTTTTAPSTTERTTKAETTTKVVRAQAQSVSGDGEAVVGARIGNFRITGYTDEEGFKYGATTASGMKCQPGICAMNNTRRKELGIKYGDKIYVEGLGTFTVADCGCPYNTVDIWCYTNKEAGNVTGYADVYYA